MQVLPNTGFSAVAIRGSSPSPAFADYTVSNTGGEPLNWSAALGANSSWASLSVTSGTIASNSSVTVRVAFTVASATLAVDTYTTTLTFADRDTSETIDRAVQLGVDSPTEGSLSVSPTTGLNASGPIGGGFTPARADYTLTNTGGYGDQLVGDLRRNAHLGVAHQPWRHPRAGRQHVGDRLLHQSGQSAHRRHAD